MPKLRECAHITMRRGAKWDVYDFDRLVSFAHAAGLLFSLHEYLNPPMRERVGARNCVAWVGLDAIEPLTVTMEVAYAET